MDLSVQEGDYGLQLKEDGYAIIRGFFPRQEMTSLAKECERLYALGGAYPRSYRYQNLLFEVVPQVSGPSQVLQVHWGSWISEELEKQRRDMRYWNLLEPLIGRNILQFGNHLHFKPPGAAYTQYRFHQDAMFFNEHERTEAFLGSAIVTALAIDPQTKENGCLRIFPGSHRKGVLAAFDDGTSVKKSDLSEEELAAAGLRAAGLKLEDACDCILEPGDLVIWTVMTVHGSWPNRSSMDRKMLFNSYVSAEATPFGEWAFEDGVSRPLGAQPRICGYPDIYDNPGPFYYDAKCLVEGSRS